MKIQGDQGLIEMPQSVTYTPTNSWKTSKQWQGPKNACFQLAASLVAQFGKTVSITIQPKETNLATITASFDRLEGDSAPEAKGDGSREEEQTNWTLTGQDQELSLWTHPQVKDLATTCPDEYTWLRKNLKIVQDKGTWKEVLEAYTSTSACANKVKDIFRLFRDGTENYQFSSYVLTKNANYRTDAKGDIGINNVNTIFSKAQLISLELMPNELEWTVPDIQWLKGTPTVSFTGGKLSVSSSFVGADSWSTVIYNNAS